MDGVLNKGLFKEKISSGQSCSFYVAQNLGNQRKEFNTMSLNAIDFIKRREKVIVQLGNGQKYSLEYKRFLLLHKEENYDEYVKVTLQKKEKF